jgi:hypothetical protein
MYKFRYDDTTAPSDPGLGSVRFNSKVMKQVTLVFIDNFDDDGKETDISSYNPGDPLHFEGSHGFNVLFEVITAPTQRAGFMSIPVRYIDHDKKVESFSMLELKIDGKHEEHEDDHNHAETQVKHNEPEVINPVPSVQDEPPPPVVPEVPGPVADIKEELPSPEENNVEVAPTQEVLTPTEPSEPLPASPPAVVVITEETVEVASVVEVAPPVVEVAPVVEIPVVLPEPPPVIVVPEPQPEPPKPSIILIDDTAEMVQWPDTMTANFNAKKSTTYVVDTTLGAFQGVLPADPKAGDCVVFVKANQSWGINTFKINRNFKPINGTNNNVICEGVHDVMTLTFVDDKYGWSTK